jgi:N-acylneuraminate cytidylyltransferase
MKKQTCFAIILARGGSVGIPRKNIQRVGGVPLVVRAIQTALATPSITEVWVSSDDDEILSISLEAGARVIRRPEEISGSAATSESAISHTIECWRAEGKLPTFVAFLQATSPFINPHEVELAIQTVSNGDSDVAFSVTASHGFLWRDTTNGFEGINHDSKIRQRRQDRESEFQETGGFYVFGLENFVNYGHRFFGRITGIPVSRISSLEIDDPIDLEIAQTLSVLLNPHQNLPRITALVTDFDGVHTNDTAIMSQAGEEYVVISRSDGFGISRLKEHNIRCLILSRETNPVVLARAQKLDIECISGSTDKASVLRAWSTENGIPLNEIAYLGNDLNDLGCLEIVGLPIAIIGSPAAVLRAARFVAPGQPGIDAVRSVCDLIIGGLATT